jgi:hypothetical protein
MTGRSRLCKVCGDWHSLARPWPHNCREPAPPRARLSAPQIAPRFEAFRTGRLEGAAIINDRREKQDYMERHDLVEYDAGVRPEPEQNDRQWREEFAQDLKRAIETDPLNVRPVDVIGQSDTDGAPEVDTAAIEVFK